jgi:hypothetical protein
MPLVKFFLPLALLAALVLSACNTLENRRSLYSTEKVHGPYTRELEEGNGGSAKTIDQQYAEQRADQRRPKLIPGETKKVPTTPTPSAGADANLPQ